MNPSAWFFGRLSYEDPQGHRIRIIGVDWLFDEGFYVEREDGIRWGFAWFSPGRSYPFGEEN